MLRVALLSSGLGHINRGIEVWSKNLAHLLYQKGVDITLFKGGGSREVLYDRVVPSVGMNSWLWGKDNHRLSWGWRYTLQQYSFTLLSIPFLRNYPLIQTSDYLVGRLLYKAKKIGLLKGRILFTDGNIFNLELLRDFTYVQETSDYYLKEADKLNIDTKDWFVIPHFVDTGFFKPSGSDLRSRLSIPEEAFVVLSVGSVGDEIKRMQWLMSEMNSFRNKNPDRDIHLVIVASLDASSNEIIEQGKRIFADNIHFLFDLPHEEMPSVYNAVDMFVLCTLVERFGLVFIEAMACGVPAIGHKFPVTEQIIGEGGECVDMTERGALAESLNKYLDPDYRNKKRKVAIKNVEENFSNNAVADKFLKMYERILTKE